MSHRGLINSRSFLCPDNHPQNAPVISETSMMDAERGDKKQ